MYRKLEDIRITGENKEELLDHDKEATGQTCFLCGIVQVWKLVIIQDEWRYTKSFKVLEPTPEMFPVNFLNPPACVCKACKNQITPTKQKSQSFYKTNRALHTFEKNWLKENLPIHQRRMPNLPIKVHIKYPDGTTRDGPDGSILKKVPNRVRSYR